MVTALGRGDQERAKETGCNPCPQRALGLPKLSPMSKARDSIAEPRISDGIDRDMRMLYLVSSSPLPIYRPFPLATKLP